MENYKNIKFFESICKNGKSYKIWWYWNPKTKISPTISIKNIDINKIDINKINVNKILIK